jgi:aarF domain-containing kinase
MIKSVRKYKVSLSIISASMVGGGIYVYNDEGSQRSIKFWSQIFPIYIHYRTIQFLNKDVTYYDNDTANQIYEKLHLKYSDSVRVLTYSLRGFYLKQAQLMSMQDQFVPPAYMKWVKDTQDNVPSEFIGDGAKHYVALKLKEEIGLEFDDVFSSWDNKPLGVASIGEVHKATLKHNGHHVAVKILCPGIESKFRSDIKTIKSFCRLAMPQHVSPLDEIEKQFLTEFDYTKEGQNLNSVRNNITPRFKNEIDIPKPYLEYCSKHILVMEFLDGVKLVDGIKEQYEKLASSLGVTINEIEEERKSKIQSHNFEFKTIEESRIEKKKLQNFLFFKDLFYTDNILRFAYNYSIFRLFYGPMKYNWTPTPIDLGRVLELLCKVQASQLFEDGFFNGDCHPGNVMLLKNGKLGFIDFGQMKSLSIEERINYSKLIIAHARMDKEEVIRLHFDVLGTKTKFRNTEIGYLLSAFYNDRNTTDVVNGMNIATFIDYCEAIDPMTFVPQQYVMAARSSIMLRGIGNAFGLRLTIAKMWQGDAERFLKSQGIDY